MEDPKIPHTFTSPFFSSNKQSKVPDFTHEITENITRDFTDKFTANKSADYTKNITADFTLRNNLSVLKLTDVFFHKNSGEEKKRTLLCFPLKRSGIFSPTQFNFDFQKQKPAPGFQKIIPLRIIIKEKGN